VIRGWWQYANPARLVREAIGAPNAQMAGTVFGGNYVQTVLSQTCLSILRNEFDVVVMTGAENGYSSAKARKRGERLAEREAPGNYDLVFGEGQQNEHHDFELARGIRTAIQVYPMYENAIRHHRGESISAHLERVSSLWARFSEVAHDNPNAWLRERHSAEVIRTPSLTNRRVSVPYTKLMNSNNAVDMGAALILCSAEAAERHGIPRSQWVYPVAGADGRDHFSASVRDEFFTSPAVRFVGRKVLELAGLDVDELDYVDLYSCFPSAVQVAAAELGLPETRPLTVTGGLTFGGGPLNNYVMHAIARTVELLRANPGGRALITANGGNLYKHAHVVYASAPPEHDFRWQNVQPEIDAQPARVCLPNYDGDVTIESYTAMFDGDRPIIGHAACRTPAGARVWANTHDNDLLSAMTLEEFCGRSARIVNDGELML